MHSKPALTGLLITALVFAACEGMPRRQAEDFRVDSIMLKNVPLTIKGQPAYKVYVYVTDSMSQNDPHLAQGTAELNGAANVTVPLYAPPENPERSDPDDHGAAWTGTASYFSVIVSPKNAPASDAILVYAGMSLNKKNQECDIGGLMDISGNSMFAGKVAAVYDAIICRDNQGVGVDITTP